MLGIVLECACSISPGVESLSKPSHTGSAAAMTLWVAVGRQDEEAALIFEGHSECRRTCAAGTMCESHLIPNSVGSQTNSLLRGGTQRHPGLILTWATGRRAASPILPSVAPPETAAPPHHSRAHHGTRTPVGLMSLTSEQQPQLDASAVAAAAAASCAPGTAGDAAAMRPGPAPLPSAPPPHDTCACTATRPAAST
ncbi:hypothetical protein Vretimale_4826 [Volvox reticuliferus]|uniref:Uncharacterized protein n=1 Tax=Volvox reticuliferus TaxID=1737510 RepID=A0A8J4DCU1_9CHLO|nr:hypothetical protein Vretimale_4826 [Volvox reticuliferus]